MPLRINSRHFKAVLFAAVSICVALASPASATTTLQIVSGSGEFVSFDPAITDAIATVKARAVNNGNSTTDPFFLSVTDFNVLMRQTGAGPKIGPLKKGESSGVITLNLSAVLPPPTSQLGQEQQIAEWKASYKNLCGVDLRASLDWAGPQAQTPFGAHQEQDLYLGYGNSKLWDENHPVSNDTICDGTQCVSLNAVSRSIHKQLACKVVGYAFLSATR